SLHNALGTKRDFQVPSFASDVGVKPLGGAREYCRAQYQQLSVGKVRQQRIDAVLDDPTHRIEKFINRGANGYDDRLVRRNLRRTRGKYQLIAFKRCLQQLFPALFHEWQMSRSQGRERFLIDVVDVDAQPGSRKCQNERNADMPAAADDCKISFSGGQGAPPGGGWEWRKITPRPPVFCATTTITPQDRAGGGEGGQRIGMFLCRCQAAHATTSIRQNKRKTAAHGQGRKAS